MTEPLAPSQTQPSLGSLLVALRQARGQTLEEVSQRLRFSVRQLQLLEMGQFDALPDMAVVRAMTRAYGRFLEADVSVLIRQLELERPDAQRLAINASTVSVAPQGVGTFTPNLSPTRRWVLAALLILFLAALVALFWHGAEAPQPDNSLPAPAALNRELPPALPTPGPAEGNVKNDAPAASAPVVPSFSPDAPSTNAKSASAPRPKNSFGSGVAPGHPLSTNPVPVVIQPSATAADPAAPTLTRPRADHGPRPGNPVPAPERVPPAGAPNP